MLDFPPRLTMEVGLQELFRQEFSVRMGLYKKKSIFCKVTCLTGYICVYLYLFNNSGFSCVCVCVVYLFIYLFFAGVKYLSCAEHFPLEHLEIWSRDGVSILL